MNQIMDALFEVSPYEGLDLQENPEDLQGWSYDDYLFDEILSKVKPNVIIEVGSWKGASAVYMGKLVKKYALDCKIVCVDTWLGSPEHFIVTQEFRDRRESLRLKNGYPQLYYTFLANIVRNCLQDTVIPLPTTSTNAAIILKSIGVRADFIYIDGAHDYASVLADLQAYWPLLTDTGILMGDDFLSHNDVTRAAHDFAQQVGLPLVGKYSKFCISKNPQLSPRIVFGH